MGDDEHGRIAAAITAELNRANLFWPWFRSHGMWTFFNWWLPVQMAIGGVLAVALPGRLSSIAAAPIVPFVGMLAGLTMSWIGNANTLLQTEEVREIGSDESGDYRRYREWVLTYQAAVLLILTVITLWALVAMGILNNSIVADLPNWVRIVGRGALFTISAIAVRECWQVVSQVQKQLLGAMAMKSRHSLLARHGEPPRLSAGATDKVLTMGSGDDARSSARLTGRQPTRSGRE